MRTTLTIDDDVLIAARDIASRDKKTVGDVISELARQALTPKAEPMKTRNGFPLLPVGKGARPVTIEMVNQLRDEMP